MAGNDIFQMILQALQGAGFGALGDPMGAVKMQQQKQLLQMKMEEAQQEKEKNAIMAQYHKALIQRMDFEEKQKQKEVERGNQPAMIPFTQKTPEMAVGPAPMEDEPSVSGGTFPTGKVNEEMGFKPAPGGITWAQVKQMKDAGLPMDEWLGMKKSDKGYGSSPQGIFSKDTGKVTTPSVNKAEEPTSPEGKFIKDFGKMFGIKNISDATHEQLEKISYIHKMFTGKESTIHGSQVDDEGNTTVYSIDPKTKSTQTFNLGKIGKSKTEKEGGLTEGQKAVENRFDRTQTAGLRKEFEGLQPTKNFREFEQQYLAMKEGFKEAKTTNNFIASDQDIIMTFNKMMDLKGTVRIEEYNRTPEDQSLVNKIQGKISKLAKGGPGLTPADREAIMRMGDRFNKVYTKKHNDEVKRYRELATMQKLDPDLVAKPKSTLSEKQIQDAKLELIKIKASYPDVTKQQAREELIKRDIDPSLFEDVIGGFK